MYLCIKIEVCYILLSWSSSVAASEVGHCTTLRHKCRGNLFINRPNEKDFVLDHVDLAGHCP